MVVLNSITSKYENQDIANQGIIKINKLGSFDCHQRFSLLKQEDFLLKIS